MRISVHKKDITDNQKNEKMQCMCFLGIYILMMSLFFISVAYNRFIDFLLFGIIILTTRTFFYLERSDKWIRHYSIFTIFAIVIIFLYEIMDILSPSMNFIQTNPENARSLISTIIQSEVAIIAIVFTLSLIAVQQTTSAYSPRVIDIFNDHKKNKPFFILFLIYSFCICLSVLLLKVIDNADPVYPLIEYCIWITCVIFIFLIFALIPYSESMLNFFKPTTLIKLLSENVSKQSIKDAIELENSVNINASIQSIKSALGLKNSINIDQSGQIKPIDDTIQPIVDVLQGSMKSYDYETTRYGLKIIEAKAIYILSDERYNTSNEDIAERIIDNIKTIGTIATQQKMEKAVNYTTDTLFAVFECLIDKEIYEPIDILISAFFTIGKQTIDEKLDTSTIYIFKKLTEIGIRSIEIKADSNIENISNFIALAPQNVIYSITRMIIDKISMENKQEIYQILCSNICSEAIESLGSICKKCIEKKLEYETSILIEMFETIGISLIRNTEIKGNAASLLDDLLMTLESITEILIKSNLKSAHKTASIIYQIGKDSFIKNNSITEQSYNLFSNLYFEIIENSSETNNRHNSIDTPILIERIKNQMEELEKLNQNIHPNSNEYILY